MDPKNILNITPEQENVDLVHNPKLIDLDSLYSNSATAKVINNGSLVGKNLTEDTNKAIISNTDGDLGFVPTCECGKTHGVSKMGAVCPDCGTKCSSLFIERLEHVAWISIPDEMGPVLHPIWYTILKKFTTIRILKKEVSLLDFVLNPELEKDKDYKVGLPEDFMRYIVGRGFKAFYENADYYLDVWLNKYTPTATKAAVDDVVKFCQKYRQCMFCSKLPILHNSLHPMTDNGATLKYSDRTASAVLEAVINLSAIAFQVKSGKRNLHVDKALFKIYQTILNYYDNLVKVKLNGKKGILRKHVFGSRIHYGFRTVVRPHTSAMPMDEIVLPWCIIVNCLKLIILNFLVKRYGKTVDEAVNIFYSALTKYDPLVEKCLRDYINETPKGKIPIMLGRNPTLNYGSMMLLYVRNFKTNPADETLEINASIVAPANIDFDGMYINNMNTVFIFVAVIKSRN